MTRQRHKNNNANKFHSTKDENIVRDFCEVNQMTKTVTLKSFSFSNDVGGTVVDVKMDIEVQIVKSWGDYEIGQRYIGKVLHHKVVKKLIDLGSTDHSSAEEKLRYHPTEVYFGSTDISNRGGLNSEQLNTLRLIRLLANDLDPERPKFKSTLDSIELQVKSLKKSLKIDTSVQESQIKVVKEN